MVVGGDNTRCEFEIFLEKKNVWSPSLVIFGWTTKTILINTLLKLVSLEIVLSLSLLTMMIVFCCFISFRIEFDIKYIHCCCLSTLLMMMIISNIFFPINCNRFPFNQSMKLKINSKVMTNDVGCLSSTIPYQKTSKGKNQNQNSNSISKSIN